jgi:hypothetical protein
LALVPGTRLGGYGILALVGAGSPTTLFETRCFSVPTSPTYDVSPDGQRFLMVKEDAGRRSKRYARESRRCRALVRGAEGARADEIVAMTAGKMANEVLIQVL